MNNDEEIVISGISGRFPECHNIEELKNALLKGEDLMTEGDKRFPEGVKGLPKRQGKVPDIDKFDASFFGLHSKQAHFTDPRQRILLETAYEAIVDAGFNPHELKGSKTGVFIGMSLFTNFNEITEEDSYGYSILGASHVSAANRISYCFDLKGPSYVLDTGCSSALYAFCQAVDMLKTGEIDYAIVGGCHIGLHPEESRQYQKLSMLSPEGKCKVFSKERNGFARSEAICCYLLQRKSYSRRIYAVIVGCKSNTNGYVKEGYTVPSAEMQFKLMKELYRDSGVGVDDVSYIEMHGTGSRVGDVVECQSLYDTFCKDRKEPLLVGSVKSNIGHTETVSGLAGITKVLLAMETGTIPANLYMEPIDKDLPGIGNKKLQIVTKNTHWEPGIVGINSFGFGGANAHVILKPFKKSEKKKVINHEHRLVQVSGRTKEAVAYFLEQIQNRAIDEECLSLVDEIHKFNIEGHHFRGYTVLGQDSKQEIESYKSEKRPVWFIFSGMGSHWPGMGRHLLQFEAFQKTFYRCASAVKQYGIDLVDVVTNLSSSTLEDLGNCFCAIIAIDISLTDLLASCGIKPDFFAGHSLGEVGCAYANGDMTPEQAVLLAYSKYYAVKQQELPLGQMAAVGLSTDEIKKILPSDVFVACSNSRNSVTISGPEQTVQDFVNQLTQKGVFARLVYTGRIAFHSKYLLDSDKHMLDFVRQIIPDAKPRSQKWLSTCYVDPKNAEEEWFKYNGAEYHTNNFINPVTFDKVFEHIQDNAIVVEIAPHGILNSIMKKEMGPNNTLISLCDKNDNNPEVNFLSSIGRIFNAGEQPNLRLLYNETVFPVRGSKMMAPLIKWDHSTSWFVPYWKPKKSFGGSFSVNLSDKKFSYLKGHNVNGQTVMPAAGFLELVWKVRADMISKDFNTTPVIFENVNFENNVILHENENVTFSINILKETGAFEISVAGLTAVTGNVKLSDGIAIACKDIEETIEPELVIKKEDFYKHMRSKRYVYQETFQGVEECDMDGLKAKVKWLDNHVGCLDTLFQLSMFCATSRRLMSPRNIRKIIIDPVVLSQELTKNDYIEVRRHPHYPIIKTKGIEMFGLKFVSVPLKQTPQSNNLLESFEFVPYDSSKDEKCDFNTSLNISIQIVLQNTFGCCKKLTIGEFREHDDKEEKVKTKIKEILKMQHSVESEYVVIKTISEVNKKFDIIILESKCVQKDTFNLLNKVLTGHRFFIYIGNINQGDYANMDIIFQSSLVSLLRFKNNPTSGYDIINTESKNFKCLETVTEYLKSTEKKVLLYSHNEQYSGIVGLQQCLLAEGRQEFRTFYIENHPEMFSPDTKFYKDQIAKDLAINVLRDNNWGTFVYLPLKEMKLRQFNSAKLSMKTVGDFTTMHWIENSNSIRDRDKQEIIQIYFVGLNRIDNDIATGKTESEESNDISFGVEYSGMTNNNLKVMGIVSKGSFSSEIVRDPDFIWKVPNYWSLQEAATVPLAYTMCYYGLIIKGKMERYDSILIYDASSDIGIAAISIALCLEVRIFCFVGSKKKRLFLKELYPSLDLNNIVTDDSSNENLMQNRTKEKGVKIVLDTTNKENLEMSLNCLSRGGKIIHINDSNWEKQTCLNSDIFLKDCSMYRINLKTLFEENYDVRKEVGKLVSMGISSGLVKPIVSTVFAASKADLAFNHLNSSDHIGKCLVEIRSEQKTSEPKTLVRPHLYFNANKTYIVIGDLGEVCLEMTDWLIKRGARKIVLNTKTINLSGYQRLCLKRWSLINKVMVQINTDDTSTLNGAENLIKSAIQLAPVGGIFFAVEDTKIIEKTETNEHIFKSKMISGENIDLLSRKYCPLLDHFVVLSSVYAGRGQAGQSTCAMANSKLERMCEKRRIQNLPALAVQWGPVEEVEHVALAINQQKILFNMKPQTIASCLDTLEEFILQEVAVGSGLILTNEKELTETTVTRSAAKAVADILGIQDFDSTDKKSTLSQLGLDSLMLAEVKHTLYRQFNLDFGPEDIRDLTFDYLDSLQENRSKLRVNVENFPPPLLSDTPVVKMNDGGKKPNGKIVFMIHPIEGYLHYLTTLAKNLSTVVYGLRCTRESNHSTIQGNAKYFIKLIKDIQEKGPYYICGYSYGSTLGFEIGIQLEMEGETVELAAIDGAPDYARQVFTDAVDMNQKIISLFPSLFKQVNLDKVKVVMNRFSKAEDSVDSIFELISQETGLTVEDVRYAGEHYFSRCKASFFYQPAKKFEGPVTLIRRLHNPQAISDDYGLYKICCRNVEVTKLNGDHITILFGENLEKLINIINNWIERDKE